VELRVPPARGTVVAGRRWRAVRGHPRAALPILALFALLLGLTLAAAPSADASAGAFINAYGWGVSDGASQFETCTSTFQTGIAGGARSVRLR
jgi:hypothetical protein